MKVFGFSDLLKSFEGFDHWLLGMGLTPRPNDRIHECFKVLRLAEQMAREGRRNGRYCNIQPRDWFALVEALEAHEIYMAFKDDRTPAFAMELKRALRGPHQPTDETEKSRDGRNIWFQLALAAGWRLGGALVSVEEPDLRLSLGQIDFLVACKRPATKHSIQDNIRKAVKQLDRCLKNSPPNHFGVIAISMNCIFNLGDQVFTGGLEDLAAELKREVSYHERYLLSIYKPGLSCILFHVSTPGLGGADVDLLHTSFTLAWDFGYPSISSKVLAEHLRALRQ